MAAPASGLIRFTNGGNTLDVAPPVFPYTTVIRFGLEKQRLDNHAFDIYDHGESYDRRWCECTWELSSTQMDLWNNFFVGSNGRAVNLTLEMNSDTGWHPFGPDKGNVGAFTVAVEILENSGRLPAPFGYYKVRARIYNASSYPAYTLPTEVSDGLFQFGTVTAMRMPTNWFTLTQKFANYATQYNNSSIAHVDRTAGGDYYYAGLEMTQNQSKMAALLEYIAGTSRGGTFTLVSQTGYEPFGELKGDGTFTVQMYDTEIMVQHTRHDEFATYINLAYVSGPA